MSSTTPAGDRPSVGRGPGYRRPVGPYVQSERMGMFKQYAEQLVAEGKAYYCFCTEERLELCTPSSALPVR